MNSLYEESEDRKWMIRIALSIESHRACTPDWVLDTENTAFGDILAQSFPESKYRASRIVLNVTRYYTVSLLDLFL